MSVLTTVGLKDVHKYSQVGQTRGGQGRPSETKDADKETVKEAKEGSERKDPKDGWDKSQGKDGWDKSNSGMKSEVREWRDSKAVFGSQLQGQNNSGLISRIRYQFKR